MQARRPLLDDAAAAVCPFAAAAVSHASSLATVPRLTRSHSAAVAASGGGATGGWPSPATADRRTVVWGSASGGGDVGDAGCGGWRKGDPSDRPGDGDRDRDVRDRDRDLDRVNEDGGGGGGGGGSTALAPHPGGAGAPPPPRRRSSLARLRAAGGPLPRPPSPGG